MTGDSLIDRLRGDARLIQAGYRPITAPLLEEAAAALEAAEERLDRLREHGEAWVNTPHEDWGGDVERACGETVLADAGERPS